MATPPPTAPRALAASTVKQAPASGEAHDDLIAASVPGGSYAHACISAVHGHRACGSSGSSGSGGMQQACRYVRPVGSVMQAPYTVEMRASAGVRSFICQRPSRHVLWDSAPFLTQCARGASKGLLHALSHSRIPHHTMKRPPRALQPKMKPKRRKCPPYLAARLPWTRQSPPMTGQVWRRNDPAFACRPSAALDAAEPAIDWSSVEEVSAHVSRTTLAGMQQLWRQHAASMDAQARASRSNAACALTTEGRGCGWKGVGKGLRVIRVGKGLRVGRGGGC
eukprot:352534-Chlamydomonas_euryale.AAC.4